MPNENDSKETVENFVRDYFVRAKWGTFTDEDIRELEKNFVTNKDEWVEITKLLKEQEKASHKKRLLSIRERAKDFFADKLIDELIERFSFDSNRKIILKREVKNELENFDYMDDFEEVVSVVKKIILTGAVNSDKKKIRWWNFAGYTWVVVKNLIALGVVFAIFGIASTYFETVVFALLILIYLSLDGFFTWYGMTTTQTAFALDDEFKRIRRLLHEEETKYEKEGLKEAKEKVDKTMVKVYINGAFVFIIYLIALFNLFSAF